MEGLPSNGAPRALIVGAGAVGRVLASHLIRGGATVAFLVRRLEHAQYLTANPIELHQLPLTPFGGRAAVSTHRVATHASVEDARAAGPWDVIVLAIPADALRSLVGLSTIPCHAVILLAAGLEDRRFVSETLLGAAPTAPAVVEGGITFIAWQAPLPRERFPAIPPPAAPAAAGAGVAAPVAYVVPGPFLFSTARGCQQPRVLGALCRALRVGGLGCKVVPSVGAELAPAEGFLMPWLVALEVCAWDWGRLRRDRELLALLARAARESMRITTMAHSSGPSCLVGLVIGLVRGWVLSIAMAIAPMLFRPFDIERYIEFHFQKVGGQTVLFIDGIVNTGKAAGLATQALEQLRARNPRFSRGGPTSAATK